jgi:predicted signal transduction protein with EAL and GGDEF domain
MLGEVPPDRFIPVAVSCGLIEELSAALLTEAVTAAKTWPNEILLSFNVSPVQLKNRELADQVLAILHEAGLDPRRLELDLTESALVQDLEGAQLTLGRLRNAGVRIALDDFGTGYSTLYHLRNFQIDRIKIDRGFVKDMESQPEAAALVRALLGLGSGLGVAITAEGVEVERQADLLAAEGCQQAQGYLYGHVLSREQALDLVRDRRMRRSS